MRVCVVLRKMYEKIALKLGKTFMCYNVEVTSLKELGM